MNKENFNVVLVDDHPVFTKVLHDTLIDVGNQELLTFNIVEAYSCTDAVAILNRVSALYRIDYIFLDINLPPSPENQMISGEDIGLKIRNEHPGTKIIIVTTYNDPYRIHNILHNINPDGFMIKNDLKPDELMSNIRHIIKEPPYYSATVQQVLRSYISNDSPIDKIDRRLLYELSLGATLSDMEGTLPLSRSAIVKRKNRLRLYFNVQSRDDRELIRKAKDKGFI